MQKHLPPEATGCPARSRSPMGAYPKECLGWAVSAGSQLAAPTATTPSSAVAGGAALSPHARGSDPYHPPTRSSHRGRLAPVLDQPLRQARGLSAMPSDSGDPATITVAREPDPRPPPGGACAVERPSRSAVRSADEIRRAALEKARAWSASASSPRCASCAPSRRRAQDGRSADERALDGCRLEASPGSAPSARGPPRAPASPSAGKPRRSVTT